MPRAGDRGRGVSGVLLLDKPAGVTSFAALRAARRLAGAGKAGHTGTLDPLATGLLPCCFGEATRFSHVLLDAEKSYRALVRLGLTTATGDLEGVRTGGGNPGTITRAAVEAVLPRFTGAIEQVPPMYSALKKDGEPLYRIARAGREVERAPRRVVVSTLSLAAMSGDEVELEVTCSKGTYVRVLAEDIGRELGCGACLAALRRTAVGAFELSAAVTLPELEAMSAVERAARLLPPDALLAALPRCDLDAEQARRVARGQAVGHGAAASAGLARLYGPDRRFLGLGEVLEAGRIVPRRLVPQAGGA
ncbi:MAG: tRNA pseudouridine(55) synthase TruB [Burkholderiales bacterium]|nr:tRNA pseudouridine(55) synthase TruB [Burkholderiales bacterium]